MILLHCLEIHICTILAVAAVGEAEYHLYNLRVNGRGEMAPSKLFKAAGTNFVELIKKNIVA